MLRDLVENMTAKEGLHTLAAPMQFLPENKRTTKTLCIVR